MILQHHHHSVDGFSSIFFSTIFTATHTRSGLNWAPTQLFNYFPDDFAFSFVAVVSLRNASPAFHKYFYFVRFS